MTKPGYEQAYEQLAIKTYPVAESFTLGSPTVWHEAKLIRSVLGHHLLVRTQSGSMHLNPATLRPRPAPNGEQLRRLIEDAMSENPQRYGRVKSVNESSVTTDTGVHINLNWNELTLNQSGKDTRLIATLYKIHYLQWWGHKESNLLFGALGLLLLVLLTLAGLFLSAKRPS